MAVSVRSRTVRSGLGTADGSSRGDRRLRPSPVGRLGAGVALVVLWSSGFVGAQLGAHAGSTLTLLTWRYLVSTAILLIACTVIRPRSTVREIGRQIVLGLLCQVGYLLPVYLGVGEGVRGGTVSLIASIQPLVVAVASGPLLGERTTSRQRIGLIAGFVGVLIVVSGDIGVGHAPWWAYLLPVLGVLSLGGGTLLGRVWRTRSFLVSLTTQTATAAVSMLTISTVTGHVAPPVTPDFALAVGWVAVLSGLGGYGAYLIVLRHQGATAVSSWLYLTPPVTMFWTWLMFGDRIGVFGIVGLLITAIGVALTNLAKHRPTNFGVGVSRSGR